MAKRPRPREQKIMAGTFRPDRDGKTALPRVSGVPTPPDWLSKYALECWQRTAGLLHARGQLSSDSEMSLIGLCQCYAEWVELAEDLRLNGRFQRVKTKAGAATDDGEDESGYMERARPSLSAFQDCDRRFKGWLIEFGLTDASRGKVSAAGGDTPSDSDPLATYGLN